MKKSLFLAALAAMSLASCSSDDVIEVKQDAITFEVVSDNASRASIIYSATNMPEKFKVYAVHTDASSNKTMYIDGVNVIKSGSSYVFEDGSVRYWPQDGSLTFYAIVQPQGMYNPCDLAFDSDFNASLYTENVYKNTGMGSKQFIQPNLDPSNHYDLIYAVQANKTKDMGVVVLNFRHAFAQVVFKAKNLSPKTLHVILKNIKINNVYRAGIFTLPSTSTDSQVTTTNGISLTNQGDWTNCIPNINDMAGSISDCVFATHAAGDYLNFEVNSTDVVALPNGNEFMMIPIENNAYSVSNTTGTSLDITAEVYNIAGTEFNSATDQLVSDGKNIPVSINWEQGKKYIYTLLFGSDGQISFELTVDDYISGTDTPVTVY